MLTSRSRLKPNAFIDSDDEDDDRPRDEILKSFDVATLSRERKAKQDQERIVISSLPNKDWKEEAAKLRKRKTYLPDQIDSKPIISQIQHADQITSTTHGGLSMFDGRGRPEIDIVETPVPKPVVLEESEDARALRELIKQSRQRSTTPTDPVELSGVNYQDSFAVGAKTLEDKEADMFRHDIQSRPDSATLDDYARIPVDAFGAALLRGMGQANPNRQQRPVEAIIPQSRPALLGIGAKALANLDDLVDGHKLTASQKERREREKKRQDMHFVPLVKRLKVPSAASLLIENGDVSNAPSPAASSRSGKHRDDSDYDSSSRRPSRRTSPDPYRRRKQHDSSDDDRTEHRRRERSPNRSRRRDYDDRASKGDRDRHARKDDDDDGQSRRRDDSYRRERSRRSDDDERYTSRNGRH